MRKRSLLDRLYEKLLDIYDWWRFLDPEPRYIVLAVAGLLLISVLGAIFRLIF